MPSVAILGPRQVGKTTLARSLAAKRGDGAIYLVVEIRHLVPFLIGSGMTGIGWTAVGLLTIAKTVAAR